MDDASSKEREAAHEESILPPDASVIAKKEGVENVKRDKHGFPLVPQPSDHKDDPLNWSTGLKLAVVLQVSWLAFLGPMSAAVANPAFVPLSEAFDISVVEASYELTMYIVWAGVGSLLHRTDL
jgi:hypothetical protein